MYRKIIAFFILFFQVSNAQIIDSTDFESTEVVIDTVMVDSTTIDLPKNELVNAEAIRSFYVKLLQLEQLKDCKLRIVHIGDSHIQADLFSGKMRALLQEEFGNGGLGFSFPYNLAKTNGNYAVKYSSNASFEGYRNIYKDTTKPVGLSGIALESSAKDFVIQITARDKQYAFQTVKLVTPNKTRLFDMATASKDIVITSNVPKKSIHKIKSGETLSTIASKYHVTVVAIKSENGLRSNNIQAGKTLRIPLKEMEQKHISRKEFIPLMLLEDTASWNYYSDETIDTLYLVANDGFSSYSLNGLILENNLPGVVYSAIGVNGAKASDYNRFPMFFNQLTALESDLVVISLGTNESFDKRNTTEYFEQLSAMIQNIRSKQPAVSILLTTPPPSLFKQKYPNTLVADYAKKLRETAIAQNVAVWDMFQELGGLFSVPDNYKKGLMSRDKVHYSKAGYEKQGQLFFEAFMKNYEQFKETK